MANHQTADPVKRIINASRYSISGLRAAFVHEQAFRQETLTFALAVPLGAWFGDTGVERALLIGSWLLVLIVELLNSAIEAIVDRIGPEPHTLSGRAKDIGSAAVMCSIALALLIWALILLPF